MLHQNSIIKIPENINNINILFFCSNCSHFYYLFIFFFILCCFCCLYVWFNSISFFCFCWCLLPLISSLFLYFLIIINMMCVLFVFLSYIRGDNCLYSLYCVISRGGFAIFFHISFLLMFGKMNLVSFFDDVFFLVLLFVKCRIILISFDLQLSSFFFIFSFDIFFKLNVCLFLIFILYFWCFVTCFMKCCYSLFLHVFYFGININNLYKKFMFQT